MTFRNYFWWGTKVLCGVALMVKLALAALVLVAFPLLAELPFWPGQSLVVAGALIHLYHYAILKREVARLSTPDALVSKGGLFRWVRHPMYLGDILVMLGLWLLNLDLPGLLLLTVGTIAVLSQSVIEDRMMFARFGSAFVDWKSRTRLILPGLV